MFESLYSIFGLLSVSITNIPRRMISSISQHGTNYVDHRRNIFGYRIKQKWYINPSPQNSVKNGKCSFEVVAFGDDIVHPIFNENFDVRKLCSSVKQKLSTFTALAVDGHSKSRVSITIHEVNLSAGNDEDLP